MIDLILEIEQDDCPFVATTEVHDVTFSASDWEFAPDERELEARMVVEAPDPGVLTEALRTLRDDDRVFDCRLASKEGSRAEVETVSHETEAMRVVREHDGYITGPFYVEDGSQLWHVGFDGATLADDALAALGRNHEYVVESRDQVDDAMVGGVIRNADAASSLLDGCRSLTDVERETIQTAVEEGYFDTPRGITLGELADRFDISKPAASKNLRRGQRKLLERAVDAIGELDGFP